VLGTLTGAAHVKTHQVLEAYIDILFGQDALVNLQHFRWRKCLFGGNAPIGPLGQMVGVSHLFISCFTFKI
jgi:hypothetical protein